MSSSKQIKLPIKKVSFSLDKNNFQIKKRKTSFISHKQLIKKDFSIKRNTYIYNSFKTFHNQRKMSFQKIRRKSSNALSKTDIKNIEEDIKYTILEMRKSYLSEMKSQGEDLFNILEKNNNKLKSQTEINKIKNKYQVQFIEDLDNYNEKIKSFKLNKKYKTFNNKNDKNKNKNNKNSKIDNMNNKIINNINNNMNNDNDNDNDNKQKKKLSSKIIVKFNDEKKDFKKRNNFPIEDKFRFISRGPQLIDSQNENESDEEPETEGFLINPETQFIFIYDAFITFVTLYFLIYIPIELSTNFCFCSSNYSLLNIIINLFFDILFVFDLIIEFFRAFYTKEEEKLVQNNFAIFNNYIRGYFFLDFLSSLPINSLLVFLWKAYPDKNCFTYEKNNLMFFLELLRCLKAIKILKITTRKKNQFVTKILEKCSDYEILDSFMEIFSNISFIIVDLHIMSCAHIFIGKHVYPGWIFKNNFQNCSSLNLYMISLYYLITTMTTVGYGEIQSDSLIEIIFRIILLGVGIICYSWLISSISNGINKQSYASINFSNECLLLERIRSSHRELPYQVYSDIKKHLEDKYFRQKKFDKDFLINSLPYSLKNNLIFSMYKSEIENFQFFKGISNTNFFVETLSYLTPISGKKNDILIKENEIFEEIYFVEDGRLALEIYIDMENPEESINRYLSKEFLDFAFDFDSQANYNQILKIFNLGNSNNIESEIQTKRASICNSLINKNNFLDNNDDENIFYLKIHDIHKNEDFGDIYMFFGKRCPFTLRVKTKRIKLYTIKKINFANLCEEYQNVFRRMHKRKMYNYKSIKNILIKTINNFCNSKGIRINEKYKETINKAIKEIKKSYIPIEILKNTKNKKGINEINEIDEEIKKTIEEFNINLRNSKIEKNSKINENSLINLLKIKTNKDELNKSKNKSNLYNIIINNNIKSTSNIKRISNIKPISIIKRSSIINQKLKRTFLEDLHRAELKRTNCTKKSSYLKNNSKKKIILNKKNNKKIKKNKIKMKSNILPNGIKLDFCESIESGKTIKIGTKNNDESYESGPKTIKILPQPLIDLLEAKIHFHHLIDGKEHLMENENIKINNNIHSAKNINLQNSNNHSKNITLNNNHNKNENKLTNTNNNKNEKTDYSNIKINKNEDNSKINFIKEKRIYSSKNKIINKNIIFPQNQFNNYEKCSITNNNILLKLDENILNKENKFISEKLSSISVESFEIKSSYKNINQVTEGAFIKEKKFQMDTIQFVRDYKNKNKNKIKRINSNSSIDKRKRSKKSVGNLFSFGNIKNVKTMMNQYLNNQIKLIRKKTMKIKREKIHKENSNNSSIKNINNINNSSLKNKNSNKDNISKLNNIDNLLNYDS